MCTFINARMTKRYQSKTDPIKAYKLVKVGRKGTLQAPFRDNCIYKLDENLEYTTRSAQRAKECRVWSGQYSEGIHSFLKKNDALKMCKIKNDDMYSDDEFDVFTVWICPEDILTVGEWTYRPSIKCIVSKAIRFDPDEVELKE